MVLKSLTLEEFAQTSSYRLHPIGAPKAIVFSTEGERDQNYYQHLIENRDEEIQKNAPEKANAFLCSEREVHYRGYDAIVAVQYYYLGRM